METITTKLTNVEDGFARVVNADTGRTMGYVTREKSGSGRTSVRWTASRLRNSSMRPLGYGDTRDEAVKVIAAHAARIAR